MNPDKLGNVPGGDGRKSSSLRRLLIVLAWTVTILALLYGEENWRGRRAWNNYRQELEARGEQLDLQALLPKPVPDEQNFAATPYVQSWFTQGTNTERWRDTYDQVAPRISNSNFKDDKGNRHFIDLVAWATGLDAARSGKLDRGRQFESDRRDLAARARAVPAVLEALKPIEAYVAEIREASRRPYARYAVNYDLENPWGIVIPHLARIKATCLRLQLRACAELAVGRSEKALEDVQLILYLADSVKDEPFMISYLVRLACVHIAVQSVWEGLAERRWSDPQLQALQARFQQYDFSADLKRPLDSERASGILTADLIRKKGLGLLVDLASSGPPALSDRSIANFLGRFVPSGWYYQEQLNYCRQYQAQLAGVFDPAKKTVSPGRTAANEKELQRLIGSGVMGKEFNAVIHHHVIAGLLLPALTKLPLKAALAQTAADHAALACALERYRLANGKFPEKLDVLAPRFIQNLPRERVADEAYKYRRTDDGQFRLYSIGWNEKDDGGVPGKVLFDDRQGDWVWSYPAKE